MAGLQQTSPIECVAGRMGLVGRSSMRLVVGLYQGHCAGMADNFSFGCWHIAVQRVK